MVSQLGLSRPPVSEGLLSLGLSTAFTPVQRHLLRTVCTCCSCPLWDMLAKSSLGQANAQTPFLMPSFLLFWAEKWFLLRLVKIIPVYFYFPSVFLFWYFVVFTATVFLLFSSIFLFILSLFLFSLSLIPFLALFSFLCVFTSSP